MDSWGIALQSVQTLFHQNQLVLETPEDRPTQALVLVLKDRPFVRMSGFLGREFLV